MFGGGSGFARGGGPPVVFGGGVAAGMGAAGATGINESPPAYSEAGAPIARAAQNGSIFSRLFENEDEWVIDVEMEGL